MSQSVFTCITCHVAFTDADIQRSHYKTDWHRYNLKRKVVALPPVSAQNFQEKVIAQQALVANNKSQENIVGIACKVCQRKFNSFNSYNNHLKSKKHKEAEQREIESVKQQLVEQQQAHHEKSVDESEDETLEQKAVNKALNEAKHNLQQPTILRTNETKPTEQFAKGDNPRMRWYQRQVEQLKKEEDAEKEESEEDDDDWEEISDEETIGDQTDSEVESRPESTTTETSSLAGVMSKIKIDSDADVESLLSEVGPKQQLLGIKDCLFCHKKSPDVESGVSHMSGIHGFFIPELKYLVDLEGLLMYLGEKVGVGNVCLWCNEKGHAFYSLKAVRTHMKDKGHCKMFTDGDAALEYADFYDFSPSYPDYDPDADSDEEEELSIAEIDTSEVNGDETEMVLPSGARIGHRSLMRYYKQNFPPVERHSQRTGRKRIDRLMAQYKAIGWHGTSGTSLLKLHDRDIKYLRQMKTKYQQKLSTSNNKTMMKHFRNQIGF
uniref:Zinc finger protein 622 n=1 Tax=Phallusia mammillata TaxID=59560 RepID=A0A6F9DYI5_9ASCI|nr:zinc finger protein 622 [Phallusia mammillata]